MIEYTNGWLPLIVIVAGIIVNLVLDLILREKAREWVTSVTIFFLVAAAFAVIYGKGSPSTDFFRYETFYSTFSLIGLLSSLLVVIVAWKEYRHELDLGVFYSLLLLANAGGIVVASSNNFISLYLGYELVSITTYAMVAFRKRTRSGAEASLKIFLLGALSSAIIVYGLSMYYGATGTFAMNAPALPASESLQFAAIALIAAGSGFKIGLVPFHFWIADVYSGASSSIVTFLAASSKKMAFAFVFQLFFVGMHSWASTWSLLFAGLAALSMLLGNIAAVMQNNVMRILAYSTIAQAGYIVIGVAAYGATTNSIVQRAAMAGILIHVIAHVLMKGAVLIATFVVIDNFGSSDIDKFKGLFRKHPVFAGTLAIGLFSLMGIPPTLGFTGKFFLFYSAVAADMIWLALIGVVGSAISIYYYGRIMRIMTEKPDENTGEVRVFLPILILLILLSIMTLILTVFTEQIIELAATIVSELP